MAETARVCKCQFPNGVGVQIGDTVLDPCKFVLSGKYKNVTVEILTCPKCGDVSIGWYRQDDTIDLLAEADYENKPEFE